MTKAIAAVTAKITMKKLSVISVSVVTCIGACSQQPTQAPLPPVTWLVPYTSDADIPRHLASNLELNRAEKLLGMGDQDRSLLKRTEFETNEQYQARGPATLASLSPLVDGRSRFVFSVPANIAAYDLATKTATVCVYDTLISQCLEDRPGRNSVHLSLSSIGLAGRAYTSYTTLKFTNADMKASPVPVQMVIEPAVADSLDTAGDLKMAFIVSFGPPFPEEVVTTTNVFPRGETVTTNAINGRLERVVVYQSNGAVAGAAAF